MSFNPPWKIRKWVRCCDKGNKWGLCWSKGLGLILNPCLPSKVYPGHRKISAPEIPHRQMEAGMLDLPSGWNRLGYSVRCRDGCGSLCSSLLLLCASLLFPPPTPGLPGRRREENIRVDVTSSSPHHGQSGTSKLTSACPHKPPPFTRFHFLEDTIQITLPHLVPA